MALTNRVGARYRVFDDFFAWTALRLVCVVGSALILMGSLTGCATTAVEHHEPPPPTYAQLMSSAEAHSAVRDYDAAIARFGDAAAADPSSATPWERSAQLQFDRGDYGRAIVSAKEALSRNPNSWLADSILTVSGLRVAVESLNRLRSTATSSSAARGEAEMLAASLRSTLGQDLLVSSSEPTPPVKKRKRPSTPAIAPAAVSAVQDALVERPEATPPTAVTDPFSVLRSAQDN